VSLSVPSPRTVHTYLIYNVFAVVRTDDTVGIELDLDERGVNMPTNVVAKRWLGFVRVNRVGEIPHFVQDGDLLAYSKATDTVVLENYSSTGVVHPIDWNSVFPVDRVKRVLAGARGSVTGARIIFSADGVNVAGVISCNTRTGPTAGDTNYGAWGSYASPWMLMNAAKMAKTDTGNFDLLVNALEMRR